jgi:hypothetical protein
MDYPLIHLFGMLQEEAHEQPIFWIKKQEVERSWIFKFWLRKLSNLRAKDPSQSHDFISFFGLIPNP